MNEIIQAILTPAFGVAISPFPIVGLILILLSKKSRINSIFYALGWIAGNTAVFVLALTAIGAVDNSDGASSVQRIVYAALGTLLILVAFSQFRKRPKLGEKAQTPGWFAKMSKIGPAGAAGFGIVLSALNPKNLLLGISAGVAVGALDTSTTNQIWATLIFVAIGSITIIVPVVTFLIAGRRLNKLLDATRDWLVQNNSIIMAVLLFMIGINIITKAL